jgi:unsaturated rhamnogalacturonyl hydrolase
MAQNSILMVESMMKIHADSIQVKTGKPANWDYEQGLFLKAIEQVYIRTGDAKYFDYIKKNIQSFVDEKGNIKTYHAAEFNSDNITTGRALLFLYQEIADEKYKLAAQKLRDQIKNQPRTQEGGFWHKDRYPNQMWLDGLYMLEPFYAEYGNIFHENNWDDIIKQFELMWKGGIDPKTGLLFHAYDYAKVQPWANKSDGHSPNFWGRSMGWYEMALVDVLDHMPTNHPKIESVSMLPLTKIPCMDGPIHTTKHPCNDESLTFHRKYEMRCMEHSSTSCVLVCVYAPAFHMLESCRH